MAKTRIHHFENYSIIKAGIEINLDMSRIEGNFNKAQYELDSAIMTSMVPFMPMETGSFINKTKAESAAIAGSGQVVAAVPPSGRFLYEGKVMIGERSKSAWAKKGERKVTTKKNLQYTKNKNPKARSHWFDAAKKQDLDSWVELVKKTAGGG